jgi:hypothetical protein
MTDTASTTSAPVLGDPNHPLVAGGVRLIESLIELLQARAAAPDEEMEERRARRREHLRQLNETARALAEHNAWLATALGACGCWGSDPDCPACRGRGGPGTAPVDREAFAAVVAPLAALQPQLFAGLPAAPHGVRGRGSKHTEVLRHE